MRLPFMKKYNIEDFEFSQNYLFLWDKVCIMFCKATYFNICFWFFLVQQNPNENKISSWCQDTQYFFLKLL